MWSTSSGLCMQVRPAAKQVRLGAPASAQSCSEPTRKGTAESQASTMLPRWNVASFWHAACGAHVRSALSNNQRCEAHACVG